MAATFDEVEDVLFGLIEEFPATESRRCRQLYRLVAGLFEDRLDDRHLQALTMTEMDILAEAPEWVDCIQQFDARMDYDFDTDDETQGYLNRLCLGSLWAMARLNHDYVDLLLQACEVLKADPDRVLQLVIRVYPEAQDLL